MRADVMAAGPQYREIPKPARARQHRSGAGVNFRGFWAALIYVVALAWALVGTLVPGHTFFSLLLTSPVPVGSAVALSVISAAPAILLPRRLSRVGSVCAVAFYFVVLLPAPLIGLFAGISDFGYMAAIIVTSLVLVLYARRAELRSLAARSTQLPSHPAIYTLLYLGGGAFSLYMLFAYPGQLQLVGLSDVYTLREAATGPTFAPYLYASGLFAGAIGPMALVYGLAKRHFILVVLACAGYLLIYMAAGNKSSVIAVPLIFAVYFGVRDRITTTVIPLLLSGVTVLSVLANVVLHSMAPAAFLVDRIMVAPAVLSELYYRYFSVHPMTLWQNSFLSFMSPIRVSDPATLVGTAYFGPGNYSNAGFFADGYAQLGYAGVALLLLAFLVLVWALDRLSSTLQPRVALAVVVPFTITILNVSPLTAILTGGAAGLATILLLTTRLQRRQDSGEGKWLSS